jgi:hypothetical protein
MAITDRRSASPTAPTPGALVEGPVSSTDNAIVRWDGTTGKAVQNSSAVINDAGGMSLTPTAGTSYAIGTTQVISGTAGAAESYSNIINIVDSADHLASSNGNSGLYVQYNVSGGAGGKTAGFFSTSLTSPTTGANQDILGLAAFAFYSVANGGTVGTPRGEAFGANFAAGTTAAATYLAGVKGIEVDTRVVAGSSVTAKVGVHIAQVNDDAVSGSTVDAGIRFANQVGAVGWDNAILLDDIVQEPMKTTGTIFKTTGSWTVAGGIDFSSLTISGNFLASPNNNFTVNGAGVADAVGYEINGIAFADHQGDYTQVYGQDGVAGVQIGDATALTNLYSNNAHVFRNRATTADFVTINAAGLSLHGSTSGAITLKTPAAAGTNSVTLPAGTTDFSATGGTSQVVKQLSAGAALTVGQVAHSDIGTNAPVTETGTTHTVAATTTHLICNNSATVTVTLPTASSFTGRELYIKNIDGTATVVSASSNVDPLTSGTAGTAILPTGDGKWAFLVSDGTDWVIMASGG